MARILVLAGGLAMAVAVVAAIFARGSDAAPAAEIQRTFVSTAGNDGSPCTRAEPCRSFQAALANTLAGGEVVALDSGGYGPFAVNRAVSVIGAPGVHAAISVFSGSGITVDAGGSDTVVLRNLYVTGLGGVKGVAFPAGGALHVESLTVVGFNGPGLEATAANASLVVRESVFRHNATGVFVNGSLRVQIAGSRADRNGGSGFSLNAARGSVTGSAATRNGANGLAFASGAVFAVSDSVADGNFNGAAVANTDTQVLLSAVVLSNNSAAGLVTGTDSPVARIGGSSVTGNDTGLARSSGTLATFGDNLVQGNFLNTFGTITAVGKT